LEKYGVVWKSSISRKRESPLEERYEWILTSLVSPWTQYEYIVVRGRLGWRESSELQVRRRHHLVDASDFEILERDASLPSGFAQEGEDLSLGRRRS